MVLIWGDPLYVYYKLQYSKCRKCAPRVQKVLNALEKTELVKAFVEAGDRKKQYTDFLKPVLIPEIISTNVKRNPPKGKPEEVYNVQDAEVSIYRQPDRLDMYYFVKYPELDLSNSEFKLMNRVFDELCSFGGETDFEPGKIREAFRRIVEDMVYREGEGLDRDKMVKILLRHTIGYGVLEPLLMDERITDVFVDSGNPRVHLVHEDYGECTTNITVTKSEIERLSTRLRSVSGRPLDASAPVLHTEMEEFGVRVCGVTQPSTYRGTGFAFRRRKSEPWTLSQFMERGMLDGKTAGLLSFLLDGQNSLLVTGPRSSGKTSLMTALLLEIPQNLRIILIEDTPEIPVEAMKELGFKIEHLKTEAFAKGFELTAEDALRTSLRLGESVLVLGEVRGPEARALFEAMRVGAAGNVVLGTIHGSSPYDTWDRVVNDLGVPNTSFKAVDLVLSTGTIRFGDNIRRHRRLLRVTEVGDKWTKEPKFRDLVSYTRKGDKWKVDIKGGEKLAKATAMKGLGMKKIQENIAVRARMKEDLVRMAKRLGKPELTGPEWTVRANNRFFKLASESSDYARVYRKWAKWLKETAG